MLLSHFSLYPHNDWSVILVSNSFFFPLEIQLEDNLEGSLSACNPQNGLLVSCVAAALYPLHTYIYFISELASVDYAVLFRQLDLPEESPAAVCFWHVSAQVEKGY